MGFWKQLKEDLGLSLPPVKTDEAVLPVLAPSVPVVAASIPLEESSLGPVSVLAPAPKRHGRKPSVPPEVQIERRRKKQRELKALQRSAAKQGKTVDQLLAEPAQIVPVKPSHLWLPGQSGNPDGRPKVRHVRTAIEKVIVLAKAKNSTDPLVATRLEALLSKVYDRAMDPDADLDQVIDAAKFIAERLEGKPTQEIEGSGVGGNQMLVVNIGTRFQAAPKPAQGDIIEAEVVEAERCS